MADADRPSAATITTSLPRGWPSKQSAPCRRQAASEIGPAQILCSDR